MERDKPLSFSWRASGPWLDGLDVQEGSASAAIILDCILEAASNGRWISYSRNRNFYTGARRYFGPLYTYGSVTGAVDRLEAMGLVEHRKSRPGLDLGRQSTIRASAALIEAVTVPEVQHQHREPIAFKDGLGRLIDYRDTERTRRMRKDLARFNEAIGSCAVQIDAGERRGQVVRFDTGGAVNLSHARLHRVFNVAWNRGGRFYGPWVQNVPKRYRDAVRIDGEATTEPDFPQLHPTLLYALAREPLTGDAYTLDHWDRPLAKRAFNIIINARSYASALGAVAEYIDAPDSRRQAAKLIADLKHRHVPIAPFFHTGAGLAVQNIDAGMAAGVICDLLKRGVVSLPIHDSFRVSERHEQATREAMDRALWKVKKAAQNGGPGLSGFPQSL